MRDNILIINLIIRCMKKLELIDALVTELGLTPEEVIKHWEQKKETHTPKLEVKRIPQPYFPPAVNDSSDALLGEETPSSVGEIPQDDAVFIQMKGIIIQHLGVEEKEVTPEARFKDLGADSLGTIEIAMYFEKEFGISIPDNVIEKFETIYDAWKYISEVVK